MHFGHLMKESDLCKIYSKLLRHKGREIERARLQESEHTVLTNLPNSRPSKIEHGRLEGYNGHFENSMSKAQSTGRAEGISCSKGYGPVRVKSCYVMLTAVLEPKR